MSAQDPNDTTAGDETLVPTAVERSELPPLRSYNVFARFGDADHAREAILSLERSGIDGRFVSAVELVPPQVEGDDELSEQSVARLEAVEEDRAMVHELGSEGAKGGALGAVLGAIGGTAVALAIPGVGAAIGAGIIAVAGGGAIAGAGVGAFAGAVSHTPASRSWERALVDIEHGQIVVGVHSDEPDVYQQGVEILGDSNPRSLLSLDRDGEPLTTA